jgi:hypothetical protein
MLFTRFETAFKDLSMESSKEQPDVHRIRFLINELNFIVGELKNTYAFMLNYL